MTDGELIGAFAERQDQAAFREIVDRYTDVLYAAARRQLRNGAGAEDVVQATFVLLARKAPHVHPGRVAGWLVKTARLVAMAANREEARRARRQREYATMRGEPTAAAATPIPWDSIAPELDSVLARLSDADRSAVTLRYLRGMSVAELATATGTSEEAARKRVNRAVDRLRADLGRRGVVATSQLGFGAILLQHGRLPGPAGLAEQAASAGLGTATPAVASLAQAAAVASQVAAAMKVSVVAAPLFLLAVLAVWLRPDVSGVAGPSVIPGPPAPTPVVAVAVPELARPPVAARTPPTSRPSSGRLRIGFILSEFTVSGPNGAKRGGTFTHAYPRVVPLLTGPGTELWAVVEPGTENLPDIAEVCRRVFADKVMDGSSVEQLSACDVLFTAGVPNMRPEVLDAMLSAVRDHGVGLVRWNELGSVSPGLRDARVLAMWGLAPGPHPFRFTARWEDCEVVGAHPVLGDLSGRDGTIVRLRPQGCAAPLADGAVPLLRARNVEPGAGTYYAVYTSTLGRGRIAHLAFAHFTQIPAEFDKAVGGRFLGRCLEWAARRPTPATGPAAAAAAAVAAGGGAP